MENLQSFGDVLKDLPFANYCSTGSVDYAFLWSMVIATLCFALTKLTNEYSWVDRIWPLLPIGYGVHYLYHQQHCRQIPIATRQIIMLTITTLWGIKHTFNFARKGGFKSGGEDYRWSYIRQNYHWILVELLNFFFIAYYQIILIQWFATPIHFAHEKTFNFIDGILSVLLATVLLTETIADQQQWEFQSTKYKLLAENGNNRDKLPPKYKLGFCVEGLWKYCRHPNFFCEISLWWLLFFCSVNSVGLNWSGIGALLLNLLFFGSTALTEQISASKYPEYALYQKTTPRLYPLPTSGNLDFSKED